MFWMGVAIGWLVLLVLAILTPDSTWTTWPLIVVSLLIILFALTLLAGAIARWYRRTYRKQAPAVDTVAYWRERALAAEQNGEQQ